LEIEKPQNPNEEVAEEAIPEKQETEEERRQRELEEKR
jgi:hypothetical protein